MRGWFLFCGLMPSAWAWFDEGHMLTAAIAKKYVKDPAVFDKVLKAWPEFANFSDIVNGAAFPDHLKCGTALPEPVYCRGLAQAADVHLFDQFHFVDMVYNPTGYDINDTIAKFFPLYKQDQGYTPRDLVGFLLAADKTLRTKGVTAPFAWNLYLRYGLHLFGDLHQPLHMGSMFSKEFKHGDIGGNSIKINCLPDKDGAELHALHQVWDSGAGEFPHSWPIDQAVIDAQVEKLTMQSPPSLFVEDGRLNPGWDSGVPRNNSDKRGSLYKFLDGVAQESHGFAVDIYEEYLETGPYKKGEPKQYCPTSKYLDFVKKTCMSQVALGGYRLAGWLNSLQSNVPTIAPGMVDDLESKLAKLGTTMDDLQRAMKSGLGAEKEKNVGLQKKITALEQEKSSGEEKEDLLVGLAGAAIGGKNSSGSWWGYLLVGLAGAAIGGAAIFFLMPKSPESRALASLEMASSVP